MCICPFECVRMRERELSPVFAYIRGGFLASAVCICVLCTENSARVQKRVLFRLLAVESFEITINAHINKCDS